LATNAAQFTLVRAGKLVDGRGGPSIDRGAALIKGSKLVAVGRERDVVAPDGAKAEVLDYPGMTLMPGMIDCHTHNNGWGDGRPGDELAFYPDEVLTLQAARNTRRALFTGVTTLRENGPKNMTMFRLRDSVNAGVTQAPRMVLCGRAVAIIGGHMGYFGGEVTGPNEARAYTCQLIKEGADYIKITATGGSTKTSFRLLPSFNVDELLAITDEAHKFGKLTATHCLSTQGIVNSLDANVDMIIHCVFNETDGTNKFRPEVVERIVKAGAVVNPTLHVFRARIWSLLNKKAQLGAMTPDEQARLDQDRRYFDVRIKDCGRMIEMGARLITGSDSSWGDYQLGNTPYETECLTMSGYSAAQGVQSITGWAAQALGVDGVTGTLEAGKEADLVVIDGDPTKDIRDLWKVRDVFLAGGRVNRGSEESVAAQRQVPPPDSGW